MLTFVLLAYVCLAVRQYWCFGYEAKNQEIKKAAEQSNYKSVLKSASNTLSVRSARSLKKRKRGEIVPGLLVEA